MKLYSGMIIQPNYSYRKYKVLSIVEGCKCPRYTDRLGYTVSKMENESLEHIHISCIDLEDKMKSEFNGFVENEDGTLRNVWRSGETLKIISTPKYLQLELF